MSLNVVSDKVTTGVLSRYVAASRTEQAIQTEQNRRIQHLHHACSDYSLFDSNTTKSKRKAQHYFSPKYNFSYCKVPKVGCSFWTQIFEVLQNGSQVARSVFKVPRPYIHRLLSPQYRLEFDSSERVGSPSVLTARDPYTRLYSAYVDKIFLSLFPVEVIAIKRSQRNTSKNFFFCAKNVTFEEFLKYIVKNTFQGKSLNRHWAPISSLCDLCNKNVFAIVKQETFAADVEYTLKKVGVATEERKVIQDALLEYKVEITIPAVIEEVLTYGFQRIICKTNLEIAMELWTTFQIQGYLRDDIPFPESVIASKNVTVSPDFLTDLVLRTIRENPLTPGQSAKQRQRALVKAYANVDKDTLDALKEIYGLDFILFNYSTEPPSGLEFRKKGKN